MTDRKGTELKKGDTIAFIFWRGKDEPTLEIAAIEEDKGTYIGVMNPYYNDSLYYVEEDKCIKI